MRCSYFANWIRITRLELCVPDTGHRMGVVSSSHQHVQVGTRVAQQHSVSH